MTADEEFDWLNGHVRVPELFHHLLAHGDAYRAVVFSPYLFWTSAVVAPVVAERAVVVPCLHDEVTAYLDVFRPLLACPAQVWFLSEPEQALAQRLGPVAADNRVVGSGVPVPEGYDPDGFRARHGLERPFVLYAGRREALKGWNDLLRAYTAAVTHLGIDLDLVTVGVGTVKSPRGLDGRVIDLGFLPAEEVADAFAAAAAYVQPSPNESFSRTVMEAWLAGTPVIASAAGGGRPLALRTGGGGRRVPRRRRAGGVPGPGGRGARPAGGPRRPGSPLRPGQLHLGPDPRPHGRGAGGAAVSRRPASGVTLRRRRRTVVFGPYPPTPGPAAEATLGEVRRLLAGGADVEVVSPSPSAAHHDADLRRPAGALRFARAAVGADRLLLHLDAELLTGTAHRNGFPARLVVAAALRSARRSTVRLPAGVPVPEAWSQVLAAADEVVFGEVAGAEPTADGRVVAGGGSTAGGAEAPAGDGARSASAVRPVPGPAWDLPAEPTREEVEAQIRRRAAERRVGSQAAAAAQAGQRTAGRTLRAMPLLGPEPPRSARFSAAVVKQVVSRLVDWRINPVIEHVNLLHRAVLDAVGSDSQPETSEAGGGEGPGRRRPGPEPGTGKAGDGEQTGRRRSGPKPETGEPERG